MTQPTARKFLVIATVLCGVAGVIGMAAALLSFMMFDAPGSEKNPAIRLSFSGAHHVSDVICIVSILLGWIFYLRKNLGAACILSSLPVLNLLCGAAALIWLEIFNGGNLS